MTTVIDGTTGVNRIADASVVQADLAPNVAGNGPCFSAYQSVAQVMPAVTVTKIQLQSKEFDATAAFDNVTNYRFQPTVPGYYQINGSVAVNSTACNIYTLIYKNGVELKRGDNINSTAGGLNVSALVFLNGSTDYLELWASFSVSQNSSASSTVTYLNGFLARAA